MLGDIKNDENMESALVHASHIDQKEINMLIKGEKISGVTMSTTKKAKVSN